MRRRPGRDRFNHKDAKDAKRGEPGRGAAVGSAGAMRPGRDRFNRQDAKDAKRGGPGRGAAGGYAGTRRRRTGRDRFNHQEGVMTIMPKNIQTTWGRRAHDAVGRLEWRRLLHTTTRSRDEGSH